MSFTVLRYRINITMLVLDHVEATSGRASKPEQSLTLTVRPVRAF